jgi:hypothetical protein
MFLAVQRIYTTQTFPYREAIKMWHEQAARRPAINKAPNEKPPPRPAYKASVDIAWDK